MNNVRDPLLFSKMQERTENVRSKCDLEIWELSNEFEWWDLSAKIWKLS